ncbi:MAG: DUF3298 and DUF4163 domain-containing protein [Roseburia sp.]|nr:DUF3298 and DUF4163 domain-containing protein [Roseburia sp.]
MRKPYWLLSISLLALALSGCSANNPASINANAAEKIRSEETEEPETTADFETKNQPHTIVNQYKISVTDLSSNGTYYAKDGKSPVLDVDVSYPSISIPDKEEISEKINTALKSEVETFWNFENENASYAREDFEMAADDENYTFEPYTASFSYTVKRCDPQIISIVFSQYDYTGGAHGNPWQYGVTFDAATGNRIQLEGLSSDYSAFYNVLLTNLNHQAILPAYQDYIFSDFAADVETALLKDSAAWYLDSSGITFISNPYVLGSYAAGTFEFNIPYSELKGLKGAYGYSGNYIRKLFPGISAFYDINTDGTEEEICYSITKDEDNDYTLSLMVNGQDFSKELKKLHITYPFTGAYYLVDIDPEDGYVEIAITDDNFDGNQEFTHFFRYAKDKTISYLGNIPKIYHEGEIICYNSNGNLVLLNSDGSPVE